VQAERARVQEAVAAAEADVSAKLADISRVEVAMRRGDREIERKTRELDALNRRLQRAMEAAPNEESLGEGTEVVSLRTSLCQQHEAHALGSPPIILLMQAHYWISVIAMLF
jgi:predicted  nucleic acid-binding Zn-ribbon protein